MSEKHAAFHRGFLWGALGMAIGVGFAIGGHLTFVLGFGFPIRPGFASFIQIHGHVQLIGWTGLLIIGVSLHFLPRLAGKPIRLPHYIPWVLRLLICGLVLRTLGQSLLPYISTRPWSRLLLYVTVLSGVLEGGGIALYIQLLTGTIRGTTTTHRSTLLMIKPFLVAACYGWIGYTCLNLGLLGHMAWQGHFVVHGAWNDFAIEGFLDFVLLPIAFAFSVRVLPLYLRLPVPSWGVTNTTYGYLLGTSLALFPVAPPLLAAAPQLTTAVSHLGALVKAGAILWFVWCLNMLNRRQPSRIALQDVAPKPRRHPTHPSLPDSGAFGRFEYLIYTAYGWLTLAACGELLHESAALASGVVLFTRDALRHMYMLGYITLLIFGIAVRMMPGFLGRRRLAHPGLVVPILWLGNAAVIGRVLIPLLPVVLLELVPGGLMVERTVFALSGILGLLAVVTLAVNLWRTARGKDSEAVCR